MHFPVRSAAACYVTRVTLFSWAAQETALGAGLPAAEQFTNPLVGVLTETRRRTVYVAGRVGEFYRRSGDAKRVDHRKHRPRLSLRIRNHFVEGLYRGARDAPRAQFFDPIGAGVAAEEFG